MPDHSLQNRDHESARIVTKAVGKAADHWGLSNHQLGQIVGLSDSTVSRLKGQQYTIGIHSKTWELALLFLRAFRGLDAYMGGRMDNEQKWLHAHNEALNGVPIQLMQDVEGLASMVQYIDHVRGHYE